MGDLIHTLPAVTDAKTNLTDLHFDWVAEESFAEIPSWHPGVDRVISVSLRRWRKSLLKTLLSGEVGTAIKQIRTSQYDYVIDAQGLLKSALITRFAKGKRCGLDFHSSRESMACLAYQQKFHVSKELHAIERIRMLFSKALGYRYDKQILDYGLNQNGFSSLQNSPPYLVFLHGTSRSTKLWPEQQWIALAHLAIKQGYTVYLTWGNESEKLRAEKIAASSDSCQIMPKMSLSEVAGLLSQASGVVGVDTGLAHLAAALAVPAVTIYTDTSPELTGTCGVSQLCLSRMEKTLTDKETAGLKIQLERTLTAPRVWASFQSLL